MNNIKQTQIYQNFNLYYNRQRYLPRNLLSSFTVDDKNIILMNYQSIEENDELDLRAQEAVGSPLAPILQPEDVLGADATSAEDNGGSTARLSRRPDASAPPKGLLAQLAQIDEETQKQEESPLGYAESGSQRATAFGRAEGGQEFEAEPPRVNDLEPLAPAAPPIEEKAPEFAAPAPAPQVTIAPEFADQSEFPQTDRPLLSGTARFVRAHKGHAKVDHEEDSDEGGNIFATDAENQLSHDKMCYIRNTRHPRCLELDEATAEHKYVRHHLCSASTGWSHCKKSMRRTDFGQYGVGLVLYFQFLKYLCVMMFLFTVLSVPSYLMFSNGMKPPEELLDGAASGTRRLGESVDNLPAQVRYGPGTGGESSIESQLDLHLREQEIYASAGSFKRYLQGQTSVVPASDDGGYLFKYSLGNVGHRYTQCNATNFTAAPTLEISCPKTGYNVMEKILHFGQVLKTSSSGVCVEGEEFVPRLDNASVYSPSWCSFNETQIAKDYIAEKWRRITNQFDKNCVNQTACSIDLKAAFVNRRAKRDIRPRECIEPDLELRDYAFVIDVRCVPPPIVIPQLENAEVTIEEMALFVVIGDVVVVFLLYISLVCLKNFQQRMINEIGQQTLTADDFAICIKNLPSNPVSDQQELMQMKAMIWAWAENVLNKEDNSQYLNPQTSKVDVNQNSVMNVNLGVDSTWKMDALLSIAQDLKVKKIYQKEQKLFGRDNTEKLQSIQEEAKAKLGALVAEDREKQAQPVLAFIQFQSMHGLRKFRDAMNIGIFKRMLLVLFCRKAEIQHKYLNGSVWPELHKAPEPSLILWKNIGCGPINRFFRVSFVTLLTIAIMASGFYAIAYGQNRIVSDKLKAKDAEMFDPRNCDDFGTIGQKAALKDYNNATSSNVLVGCYCYQQLKSMDSYDDIDKLKFDGVEENVCLLWLQNSLFERFSAPGIAGAISLINIIQLEIFKFITGWEGHHFATSRMTSSMLKMLATQFINIGFILLMIYANAKHLDLPPDFPLLQGSYKKFTPQWYKVVGSTICVTMLSQTVLPHLSFIVRPLRQCLAQLCDQKCTCSEKATMQILQEDYEAKYMGPHFEIDKRYSTLLAQMFIVMTFSTGLPILYPIGMLCVMTTYWVDKFLFIRFYRIPPMYDSQMANAARNALKISIVIHCLMSFYIYSNDDIFYYKEDHPDSIFFTINQDVDDMLKYISGMEPRKYLKDLDAPGVEDYVVLHMDHAILYLLGLLFVLIFVLLEEGFGFLSSIGECFSFLTEMEDEELLKEIEEQLQMQENLARLQQMTDENGNRVEMPQPRARQNRVAPMDDDEYFTSVNARPDLEDGDPEMMFQDEQDLQGAGENNTVEQLEKVEEALPPSQPQLEEGMSFNPFDETGALPKTQAAMGEEIAHSPAPDGLGAQEVIEEGGGNEGKLGNVMPLTSTYLRFKQKQATENMSNLHDQVFRRMTQFKQFQKMGKTSKANFSCNIYSELSIEDLQREYQKNVAEVVDYQFPRKLPLIYHNPIKDDYRAYMRARMVQKNKSIKAVLSEHIKVRGLRPSLADPYDGWAEINQKDLEALDENRLNMTAKDFEIVFEALKAEADYYRIKSTYCYDIQDHPDFLKSSKIIKRIKDYTREAMAYV